MEDSPPLNGTLVLGGRAPTPARFLLGIPGGLHFRRVYVGGVGKTELDEILAACSLELETLSLRPWSRKFAQYQLPPGKVHCRLLNISLCYSALVSADLSRNMALTRFELRVDQTHDLNLVLSPLRKTLSTISSPVFSEFILKIECCPSGIRFLDLLSGEVTQGDEWKTIDSDLNDMSRTNGRDIRLAIRVGVGDEIWSPALRALVGDVFPLMNARGLVDVEVVKLVRV